MAEVTEVISWGLEGALGVPSARTARLDAMDEPASRAVP